MKQLPMLSAKSVLLLSVLASALSGCGKQTTEPTPPQPKSVEPPKELQSNSGNAVVHHATGVVKGVDPEKGTVMLSHGPIQSLNWPAMTMNFSVKDKILFDKLAVDKKVDVDIMQQGSAYLITNVK